MRIINDVKLDFDDVLIIPKRSKLASRSEVDLTRTFTFKWPTGEHKQWTGIPLFAANMDTIATASMRNALQKHKINTALHKHYLVHQAADLVKCGEKPYTWYSLGITKEDRKKFDQVKDMVHLVPASTISHICIDVANGYTESFVAFVTQMRKENPDSVIMAGNVVTPEITEQLIFAGADIVKVGIGPGSVCTTRKVTGIGYPQLSAIIECADAAHGAGGMICGDGGCRTSGDIAKAFAGGADFVMLGGMLAGTDESEGTLLGSNQVEYYGMSSYTAQEKYSDRNNATYRASEGKRVLVPYKGSVDAVINEILGGLRSTCTYVGAKRLKELPKRATFILVNRQRNTVFDEFDA